MMMKRTFIILIFLCSIAGAANEINAFIPGVTTAYSVVREKDGDVWHITGQVFEAWGTAGRTAVDYDISLTDKSGGMFTGNFDTNVSAGHYHIVTYQQEGASPDDTDPPIWQIYGYWTGTTWTSGPDAYDIDAIKVLNTTVADVNDANNFILTDAVDVNDMLVHHLIMVQDADDSHYELRRIYEWNSSTDVTVDGPFTFVPAIGDTVQITGSGYGLFFDALFDYIRMISAPVYHVDYTGKESD